MKKLFWMAGIMMFAACSNNNELLVNENTTTESGRTVIAMATLPGGTTRLAMEEVDGKSIKVNWKESGETFSVLTAVEGDPVTFTQTDGNLFTGVLPNAWDGPYYAFYPEVMKSESGYGEIEENVPVTAVSAFNVPFSLQQATCNLESLRPLMVAVSEDGENFAFEHLTAIVKFTLTGLEEMAGMHVEQMSLQSDDFVSDGFINLKTREVTPSWKGEDQVQACNIIVWDGGVVAPDGTCTAYFCVPPISKDAKDIFLVLSFRENEKLVFYVNMDVAFTKDIEAGKFYRVTRQLERFEIPEGEE